MRGSRVICLALLSLGLSIASFDADAQAQMYPQDIHSQHKATGLGAPAQQPFGGMGVDSASAFLQRREEEERERRESWERQRRMMENFTNIPEQLRESYFRRPDIPFNSR
jgi:hypothetical protein